MKVPVLIVGAGPTGLTAAALLGRSGVECLVLERQDAVYPRPRAVHLDDEVYRILGRLGLAGEFAAISRPSRGLRLLDPELRVLAEFRRSPDGRHGHPEANMFDQPDLEHLLRTRLETIGTVTLRGNTEVTGIRQDGTGVRAEVTDRGTGAREVIHAEYVLGCDGANSLIRTSIGATMADLKFAQRWLVVDVAATAGLDQWDGVHQVCDPRRAATYMRIGKTRHRWEFRLLPGETGDDFGHLDRLHPLIAPWTGDVPAGDLEIVRVAEYTFRARIANRWRSGRVFLLGDAAHLTPPFIGQGMGAGLRDAANLTWKLAGVLGGTLPESALGTYEAERKPHARSMIRRAVLIGKAMTEGGRFGTLVRRVAVPRMNGRVFDSATPALRRSALVARPRFRRSLAGRLCPNALLDDGTRFDDVAGGRFAVVTTTTPSETERAAIRKSGAVLVPTSRSGELRRWLRTGAAVVRPDGTVLSAGPRLFRILRRYP
ncbi:bifunctional 3-(3-hydroxy-phenyl)propionate/3-hydroxycinnamic acid hydroxylase [Amycolatopsis sp. NPDC049688]|uniref:bifunctional 3-(3-hydroxy-phenyl)propionate/3-hydroxycinnamic acid hydroxylase MhpA n=1 Tax=Amycolatopsis sp. NPDC049688 TaxID=3154733 RepID=UPI0034292925